MRLSVRLKPHGRKPIHIQAGGGDPTVLRHPVELEVREAPLQPDARRVAVKTGEVVLGQLGVMLGAPLVRRGRVLQQQGRPMVDEPGERQLRCALRVEWWRKKNFGKALITRL